MLEAFKGSEKDYKPPSTIRERMLEEQEMYLARVVTFYSPDKSTEGKDIRWCLDNEFFRLVTVYGRDLGTLTVKRNGTERTHWTPIIKNRLNNVISVISKKVQRSSR